MCYLCDLFFSHNILPSLWQEAASPNCCECSSLVYFIHTDQLLDHSFLQELEFALEASDGVVRLSNVSPNWSEHQHSICQVEINSSGEGSSKFVTFLGLLRVFLEFGSFLGIGCLRPGNGLPGATSGAVCTIYLQTTCCLFLFVLLGSLVFQQPRSQRQPVYHALQALPLVGMPAPLSESTEQIMFPVAPGPSKVTRAGATIPSALLGLSLWRQLPSCTCQLSADSAACGILCSCSLQPHRCFCVKVSPHSVFPSPLTCFHRSYENLSSGGFCAFILHVFTELNHPAVLLPAIVPGPPFLRFHSCSLIQASSVCSISIYPFVPLVLHISIW